MPVSRVANLPDPVTASKADWLVASSTREARTDHYPLAGEGSLANRPSDEAAGAATRLCGSDDRYMTKSDQNY
jgi:hypothetical protein